MPDILGRISLFPYDFEPQGWKFCQGGSLPISTEYLALFQLLGTTFGGDGQQTFGLPNFQAPPGCHYGISMNGASQDVSYWGVVGETLIWIRKNTPQDLVECAGESLPSGQYPLLEMYLGTRFGDQGADYVVVPDLRGKAPAHSRYLMAERGEIPEGSRQDILLGEILLLPYDRSYQSLRICNGELLQIAPQMGLYSVLGKKFGGDGTKTFALPDLRQAAPTNFNYYISIQGIFPSRT
jgi:microcystin-dependent protein